MAEFDISRFLDLSGAVRIDDLDWEGCRKVGLTPAEARIVRYMADTETHTILYMRDLLAGHSAKDPEITAFLSVWVYEELWHGRALSKVLAAAGYPEPEHHYTEVTAGASIRELIEAILSSAAAFATPRFIATHMTWGAINELTAAAAYAALEARTENPALLELLKRIAKQERKHFSFYFTQAKKRLEGDKKAQTLTRFALQRFWTVVGSGVGGQENLDFIAAATFRDDWGRAKLKAAEETIHELPGMEWFTLLSDQVAKMGDRYIAENGPVPEWPLRDDSRPLGRAVA